VSAAFGAAIRRVGGEKQPIGLNSQAAMMAIR
jgi:hypothetical protein